MATVPSVFIPVITESFGPLCTCIIIGCTRYIIRQDLGLGWARGYRFADHYSATIRKDRGRNQPDNPPEEVPGSRYMHTIHTNTLCVFLHAATSEHRKISETGRRAPRKRQVRCQAKKSIIRDIVKPCCTQCPLSLSRNQSFLPTSRHDGPLLVENMNATRSEGWITGDLESTLAPWMLRKRCVEPMRYQGVR